MMKPKFIPILFSTVMVKAILADKKSQTRRIMNPQPKYVDGWWKWEGTRPKADKATGTISSNASPDEWTLVANGYKGTIGDILWVRETWCNDPRGSENGEDDSFYFRADMPPETWKVSWKPSIFMPKQACRIFLEITDVRIEQLNKISEFDAKAEGVFFHVVPMASCTSKGSFINLWKKINGDDSWGKNPWVWVIEFKRIEKPKEFVF
jgi:hypothetical protein